MKKSTDDLIKILSEKPNAENFLKEQKDEMLKITLPELLNKYLADKGITCADAIKKSNLNRTYAYQIFNGAPNPGRNKLLCLAFGLGLTVDEVQTMLKVANQQTLYPRIPRDVIIMESLYNNKTILECNEMLYNYGLDILE